MLTKIVLTGGPCAGKSTILKKIEERYASQGYAVYALPESATLFSQAGADFLTSDAELSFVTEKSKLRFQLAMEDTLSEIANASGRPALMICDRGAMDTAAYISEEVWQRVLDDLQCSEKELCEQRYDAVLHVCTAAKGAEASYTLLNNACRSESIEQARAVDDNLMNVWKSHPHLNVIQAEVCFEDKINNVLGLLDRIIQGR